MARKRVSPTESEAIFQDVVASADDTPRLVYADWLDDHGEPRRAEFIRLQCRLAGLGEDDPEREALVEREWELLTVYGDRWQPAWPAWALREPHTFRRGFVATLSLTPAPLRRDGNKLFAAAPLEELHLRAVGGRLAEVLNNPNLARLRALDLGGNYLTADDVQALTRCSYLTGMTWLDLSYVQVYAAGLKLLADWTGLAQVSHLGLLMSNHDAGSLGRLLASPHLTGLTSLNLGFNHALGDEGMALLAQSPRLRTLTWLALPGCYIGQTGLRALVNGAGSLPLQDLDLGANPVGPAGAAIVAGSRALERLTTLRLGHAGLGNEGVTALANSPHLGKLRRLSLGGNDVGAEGLVALGQGRLGSLVHLDLGRTLMVGEGTTALVELRHLPGLTSLHLDRCRIGPNSIRMLASAALPRLRDLRLAHNDLGQGGLDALVRSPNFPRLSELDLTATRLADEDVRGLGSSGSLRNLRRLRLDGNRLTDEAATELAQSPNLGNLRQLTLTGNHDITVEGARALAASPALPRLIDLQVHGLNREQQVALLREYGKCVEV